MTNEELEQKVKRLEEQLTEVRIALLESKADKKPYEVEVPTDIEDYYYVDELGRIYLVRGLLDFDEHEYELLYKRGLAFKTKEEAEQYDRERILLFKMHKWAEEYNEGWYPDWEDCDDKFYIAYHHGLGWFKVCSDMRVNSFNKLPYFKSNELALEFIEEFGDEIKEVLF